ncbi:MAG: hypothetical protein GX248_09225 [Peptococcaceae bacterium]|nr:hypothetical protein [Peptococcaceae bacterium]
MIDLQVRQQFGQIGMETVPYKFDLKIRSADLEVKPYPARIELKPAKIELNIDYTPSLESMDLRGIQAQAAIFRQDAQETVQEGIARRAQQGQALGDLSKKVTIGQIVKEAMKPKEKTVQLAALDPIKIEVITHALEWDAEMGGLSKTFTPGEISSEFQYGKVNVYLEREPYIEIKAVGSSLDYKV